MESNRLDWLASEVVAVLRERLGDGYAAEKEDRLRGLSRAQVMVWCNNLDEANTDALAARLGADPARLRVAFEVTRDHL